MAHGAINLTLQSNFDGDATGGAIKLGAGTFATDGGSITIGGWQ
ncbi:MAG: hypothetical protein WDN72_08115 [Alphaproteobacteria bacterium]